MPHLAELVANAKAAVEDAQDVAALDLVRVEYFGKKGHFTLQMQSLRDVPAEERAAHYTCAAVVHFPDGRRLAAIGTCSGFILTAPRGHHGFGYDPHFYLPEFGRTAAELTSQEKNAVSHRGKALDALRSRLRAES